MSTVCALPLDQEFGKGLFCCEGFGRQDLIGHGALAFELGLISGKFLKYLFLARGTIKS